MPAVVATVAVRAAAGPERIPSGTIAGVSGDGLRSARTDSDVDKTCIMVEGRAAGGDGGCDSIGGVDRGGMMNRDAVGGGDGVADEGGTSTGLADGGRNGGWDCPNVRGCPGRGADTSGRIVGALGGTASRGCGCGGRGSVGDPSPGVVGGPSGAGGMSPRR